ncbi:TetR/AcrR family transcriptional regulator C-terminal domain-containing protein [Microbacterium sp. KUDC0406]|uniref:TetR/AcrR family transcriptional regulator n=1 Tax=Microbacterium sp. KUDC0406 TaxID=2909588 RepID=UPI001F320A86|nr:TetR/AcrR family transcriptional regulator C-terminal domain-containing protein [Microbacterium sp. KUDC0406]UJP08771.1 TetR/AcrR family transcriptional regulator C-terminal domain-containing protein [Microbacterium sp. KUDC0406]
MEHTGDRPPRPKPRHTLEGITDAAIAIADAEGLEAVTMQRVAERIGSTKMGLYRYLPGRSDLDAAMLDRALGTPPAIAGPDWRRALTIWAEMMFARVLERPWAVELAQRPHVPGPTELTWYEAGLAPTAELPLTAGERLDVLALLSGHAQSLVRQQAQSAIPEDDLAARIAPLLTANADRYPRTAAAFAEAGREDSRNRAFDFGVQRILAGVAALVSERAPG